MTTDRLDVATQPLFLFPCHICKATLMLHFKMSGTSLSTNSAGVSSCQSAKNNAGAGDSFVSSPLCILLARSPLFEFFTGQLDKQRPTCW